RDHRAGPGRAGRGRRPDPQAAAVGGPPVNVRPGAVLLGAVGVGAGVLAVGALREATMSTHSPVPPESQVELVVTADDRGAETGQALHELVEAQITMCRLEVPSDVVGEVDDLGGGRFRAVLSPGLDQT